MHRRKGGKSTGPLSSTPDLSLATKMDWDFHGVGVFTPENTFGSLDDLTSTPGGSADDDTETDDDPEPPIPVVIPIQVPAWCLKLPPGGRATWITGFAFHMDDSGQLHGSHSVTATYDGTTVLSQTTPLFFSSSHPPNPLAAE